MPCAMPGNPLCLNEALHPVFRALTFFHVPKPHTYLLQQIMGQ